MRYIELGDEGLVAFTAPGSTEPAFVLTLEDAEAMARRVNEYDWTSTAA